MDCEQAVALISARLDHENQPDDRVPLDLHLRDCPACRAVADAFALQHQELRGAFEPRRRAAAAVADRVNARLPAARAAVSGGAGPGRRFVRAAVVLGAVAAVAAFLLLAQWRSEPQTHSQATDYLHPLSLGLLPPDHQEMTARPRPEAPPVTKLAVGESVETRAGEKRRLVLPDNSVLFVNQNTRVRLNAGRDVTLSAGAVYVEVSPRAPDADGSTFAVHTPEGAVQAFGTKFAVEAGGDKPLHVAVTQGRVALDRTSVSAGQELYVNPSAAAEQPTPAPRVSHLLDWTRDLMAAAESPLVPASDYGGGALVAVDPYGQEAKLSLRKYHIDVHVEDGFARTTIDQTYFNHNPWQLEGTFYFPLPPDASLSRLAMYVNGDLMEGGMTDREWGNAVYEKVVRSKRDPALLEWVDGSTFKMRVFPLEGRQEKRIVLSYTQRLSTLYGRTQYRFPAGHSLQVVDHWSFHARVKNGAAEAWASPSHPAMRGRPDAGDLLLDAADGACKVDRDVEVDFADPQQENASGERVRCSSAWHEGAEYLMLRFRPELPARAERQRRDWVFLFESSADRDPLLARTQIDVIRHMLEHVEHDDTFAVLTAGTTTRRFADAPVPATPENVAAAVDFLERTHLIGALDLGRALTDAAPLLQAGQNPYLVHVGSGLTAMGRRQEALAELLPAGVRYVGVGVGKRWNRSWMKERAESTGGYFTQVNPDEPIAWRAFDLLSTLNTPRLLNVQVAPGDGAPVRFLTDNALVAQGEEVCAVALVGPLARPCSVVVTGVLDGQPYRRELPVADVAPHADYLPRSWARLEIDRLLAANANGNKDRIVALSKAMYVMTPFTSLLVLESEAMYKEYNVDSGRKDHWAMYPCPDKIPIVFEPDPTQPIDVRNAPKTPKPVANLVQPTVVTRQIPRFLNDGYSERDEQPLLKRLRGILSTQVRLVAQVGPGDHQDFANLGRASADYLSPANLGDNDLIFFTGRDFERYHEPGPSGLGYYGSAEALVVKGQGRIHARLRGDDDTAGLIGDGKLRIYLADMVTPVTPGQSLFAANEPFTYEMRMTGRIEQQSRERIRQYGDLIHMGREEQAFQQAESIRGIAPNEDRRLGMDVKNLSDPGNIFDLASDPSIQLNYNIDRIEDVIVPSSADHFRRLIEQGWTPPLLYQRPSYTGDARLFSDLVSYAPGLNTTDADVRAVLDAEAAPNLAEAPGHIDADALRLIEQSRRPRWRTLTLAGNKDTPDLLFYFDGAGRYVYEHALPLGLHERVVCDGVTLWYLYPEIGLAARRTVSRFHRAESARLTPWALPPAEDLARGADVESVDDHTVALIPLGARARRTDDDKPAPYYRLELVFAPDGWLAERRLIEAPVGKVVLRETYDNNGGVRVLGADGKEKGSSRSKVADALAPDLSADTTNLVVVRMPLRSRARVYEDVGLDGSRLISDDLNGCYSYLEGADAVELLSGAMTEGNAEEARVVFRDCFEARGDVRPGLFTLLSAAGVNVCAEPEFFSCLSAHKDDLLMRYFALAGNEIYDSLGRRRPDLGAKVGPADGFLGRLAEFHDLVECWWTWQAADQMRNFDFIRQNRGNVLGQALQVHIQFHDGYNGYRVRPALAETWAVLAGDDKEAYTARYEQARCLFQAGKGDDARRLFLELYAKTLKAGVLPPIDVDFQNALRDKDADGWSALMWRTVRDLIDKNDRPTAVMLAWQCRQVGDAPLSDNLLSFVLEGVPKGAGGTEATLTAVEYLSRTDQLPAADDLLRGLLADEANAKNADLWRLATNLAERRQMPDRAAACLETALNLEYQDLPPVIDLQSWRADYGKLLSYYQSQATTLAGLHEKPPAGLAARTIRAADRWRSHDPEAVNACQQAGAVLKALGEREAAWEYLTTSAAFHPDEVAGWAGIALAFSREGDLDLAENTFAAACERDPADALLLWQRAQNLRQAGREGEAEALLRRLADGEWPEQFQWVKAQARWQLGRK